jgi:hypothetical protein
MSTIEIIDEGEVSIEKIENLFKKAFIKAKTLEDREVWVETESTIPVKIEVYTERKMIKFQSSTGIKMAAPNSEKHKFVNKLNGALLVRFYIYDDCIIVGDYYLPYEGGITAFQIVNVYRIFSKVFIGILRDVYTPGGLLDL